jgi:hypothetical protein
LKKDAGTGTFTKLPEHYYCFTSIQISFQRKKEEGQARACPGMRIYLLAEVVAVWSLTAGTAGLAGAELLTAFFASEAGAGAEGAENAAVFSLLSLKAGAEPFSLAKGASCSATLIAGTVMGAASFSASGVAAEPDFSTGAFSAPQDLFFGSQTGFGQGFSLGGSGQHFGWHFGCSHFSGVQRIGFGAPQPPQSPLF